MINYSTQSWASTNILTSSKVSNLHELLKRVLQGRLYLQIKSEPRLSFQPAFVFRYATPKT